VPTGAVALFPGIPGDGETITVLATPAAGEDIAAGEPTVE